MRNDVMTKIMSMIKIYVKPTLDAKIILNNEKVMCLNLISTICILNDESSVDIIGNERWKLTLMLAK